MSGLRTRSDVWSRGGCLGPLLLTTLGLRCRNGECPEPYRGSITEVSKKKVAGLAQALSACRRCSHTPGGSIFWSRSVLRRDLVGKSWWMILILEIWSVLEKLLKAISMALHSMECSILGKSGSESWMRASSWCPYRCCWIW